MLNAKQLALWNAVAAIRETVQASWSEEDPDEYESVYPVGAEELWTLDTALAAGADPNQPMTADEYFTWLDTRADISPGVAEAMAVLKAATDALLASDRPLADEYIKEFENGESGPGSKLFQHFVDSHPDQPIYILGEWLDFEVVRRLVGAGANPNLVGSLHNVDEPLLHHLIRSYDVYHRPVETLDLLLSAGAQADCRGEHGRTLLQHACVGKLPGGFIRILLRHGASVTAMDDHGNTALHLAAHHDEGYRPWPLDADEGLMDDPYAFGPWEPRNDDYRLLGAREAVSILVDAGADPNAVNPQTGQTPMHYAINPCYLYVELIEALFERGGRADIPDRRGYESTMILDYHFEQYGDERARKLKERFLRKS